MTKKEMFLFIALMIISVHAESRDLVGAATSLKSLLIQVGVAVSGISIVAGGICWNIGAAEWGKRLLIGGIVGAAITAGYAGIESAIRSVAG